MSRFRSSLEHSKTLGRVLTYLYFSYSIISKMEVIPIG